MHKELSNLEEIAIRFIWCKVDIEGKTTICFNFLFFWQYIEWILHKFACGFIVNW